MTARSNMLGVIDTITRRKKRQKLPLAIKLRFMQDKVRVCVLLAFASVPQTAQQHLWNQQITEPHHRIMERLRADGWRVR